MLVSEDANKQRNSKETVTSVLITNTQSVVLMVEITKMLVIVNAKELVRNILKVLVLLRNLVPDVQVFWIQFVLKMELLMTICVTYNVLEIDWPVKDLVVDTKDNNKTLPVLIIHI